MPAVKTKDFFVWKPIKQLVADVKSQKQSCLSQIEQSLKLIEELNPTYKAVISTCSDRAMQRAKEMDAQIAKGKDVGILAGVPFIAKDNFLTFGGETTAASNMLKGFRAPYQSTAVEKLEAQGAICVAKSNLDAFAHGSSTENSDFFTTLNPHDITKVPGGSSGGSAAAVALGMAPFALGTDTGGSIRLPASYCGVVGYKPTYGLVSRSGVVAMASSTDVIGPLTRSVEDTGLVLEAMSGHDVLDSTSIEREKASYIPTKEPLKDKKIGVIKEYFGSEIDPKVKEIIKENIETLKSQGAVVEEVSLPTLPLALAVYYVVVPAELSSNLSRYDGQRYEYAYPNAKSLDESYLESRTRGLGDEAKRRIMIGTHVLSSGYYDAYYKKAQTVRTVIIEEFDKAFNKYDFLVGPVAPNTAFKIGENDDNPLAMYLMDVMTVGTNLVGVPAISIPSGVIEGMPVGFQVIAPQRADSMLLSVARSIEGIFSHES